MLRTEVPPAAQWAVDRATAKLHELAPQGPLVALPALDCAIAELIDLRARGDIDAEEYITLARELIRHARGLRLIDEDERVTRSFDAGVPGLSGDWLS
jgi:hypothetical protein